MCSTESQTPGVIWGGRMKNPSKKKGLNGRRTKTSKRRAPKRTEKKTDLKSTNLWKWSCASFPQGCAHVQEDFALLGLSSLLIASKSYVTNYPHSVQSHRRRKKTTSTFEKNEWGEAKQEALPKIKNVNVADSKCRPTGTLHKPRAKRVATLSQYTKWRKQLCWSTCRSESNTNTKHINRCAKRFTSFNEL